MIRMPALAAATLLLAACTSILPKEETLQVYQLPGSAIERSREPALPYSIRIGTPEAGQLTGGRRILVLRDASRVSVYENARWIDPAAQVLRNRIADAFRVDGRFRTVTTDSSSTPVDLDLSGELATFQVEYSGGTPRARIVYDAVFNARGPGGEIVSRRFEVAEPLRGDKVPEVVEAFGRASDRLASEIIAWVVAQAPRPR